MNETPVFLLCGVMSAFNLLCDDYLMVGFLLPGQLSCSVLVLSVFIKSILFGCTLTSGWLQLLFLQKLGRLPFLLFANERENCISRNREHREVDADASTVHQFEWPNNETGHISIVQ